LINKQTIIKILKKIKIYGLYLKAVNFINFQRYCFVNRISHIKRKEQKNYIHTYSPLISIVIPLYNTKPLFFHQMMKSIMHQTYSNWEICFCDGSTISQTRKLIEGYQVKLGDKLKVKYIGENLGIAGNTNEAIKLASGDFIGFMDHDDMLSEDALFEIVKSINQLPDSEIFYSDEDKVDYWGKFRFNAFFKPAYSPDTLRSYNYICHFFVVSMRVLNTVGYCRSEFNGSQDYDLILRVTEQASNIVHIPKILYHWRQHFGSTAFNADSKPYVFDAAKRAIADHLCRIGINGDVEITNIKTYHVTYLMKEHPQISIVIVNDESFDVLINCIKSILINSTYTNYEIMIIDNNKLDISSFEHHKFMDIKIINYNFINLPDAYNFASTQSDSPYLIFLSGCTTVISTDWIERMLEHFQKDSVGVVGPKLLSAGKYVQLSDEAIELENMNGYPFTDKQENENGYFCVYKIIRNVTALAHTCLMVNHEVFDKSGKFNTLYSSACFSIEFSLKIIEQNLHSIYTPFSLLYNLCADFKDDEKLAYENEKMMFNDAYRNKLVDREYHYNPNLSLDSVRSLYKVNVKNHDFRPRVSIKNKHVD